MTTISFKRLLAVALGAAIIGSTVGSFLLCIDEITAHPLRKLMGHHYRQFDEPLYRYVLMFPAIWMISLLGTIPGSMLIGAPAIYPVRHQIARNPVLWSLPVMIYAAVLATLLLGWMVTPTASGDRFYETIWFYSLGCALGFVSILGWRRTRKGFVA